MAPIISCRECGKNIYPKQARATAWSLMDQLVHRRARNGKPYLYENEYFCSGCRNEIKPTGKSKKYPRNRFGMDAGPSLVEHSQDDANMESFQNVNLEENRDVNMSPSLDADAANGENEDPHISQAHPESESSFENSERQILQAIENVEIMYSASETSEFADSGPCRNVAGSRRVTKKPCSTHRLSHIKSIPYTQSHCCVCKMDAEGCRAAIPEAVRLEFWRSTRIWLPSKNRSCPSHHDNTSFSDEVRQQLLSGPIKDSAHLTEAELEGWLHGLTDMIQENRIDISSSKMDDVDYQLLFGVNKLAFDEIFSTIQDHLRSSIHRTPKNALALFLTKLRLGISQRMLGFLYGVTQRGASRIIARVAKLLEKYFVPKYLGFAHKERQEVIGDHDSEFVRKLYGIPDDYLILILDGTYLYTEKSSDHRVQKKSFSMQKGRNLLKVMVVVTPTGYIVDIVGVYFSDGHHNDAKILQHMFEQEDGIATFVKAGDLFILDRGFRDVIAMLEEKGIQVKMPNLLKKNQRQFTDEEANESRLVTLTRWVVESVNGRLKNMFRFFDNVISHHYFNKNCTEKLRRYLRIACAIMNKCCPPIFEDKPKHFEMLDSIMSKKDQPNDLQFEIEKDRTDFVTGRKCWKNITAAELISFPHLSLDDLSKICLGKFCIDNARGYTDDHLRVDPNYNVQLHATRPGILRVKLKSKYRGSSSHYQWIEFSSEEGEEKITRYYCQCQGGAKSLGCCSHVTSVLWYLGYKRHVSPNYQPCGFGEDILEIVARKKALNADFADLEGDEEESVSSDED